MDSTKIHTHDACEQLPVSSERTFPPAPFPQKFVHGVVDDLFYAVQAVLALRIAGYDPGDIHIMASWDFVEAVERKEQQQSSFAKMCSRFCSFFDEGLGDVYLHEALRGRHILAVRLARKEQMEQVRDLLADHHASHMKYVDAWTVADLLSSREENMVDLQIFR